jgi:hypothetical protein
MQQGRERQKLGDFGPQFYRQLTSFSAGDWILGGHRHRPGSRQFRSRTIRQLDQIARLRVSRMPGPTDDFYGLVIQWVVGMDHTHHSDIV